jgi:carboxyl-terminal processing protease
MDNIGEADLDYPVKFDRVPEASFEKLKMNRQDITAALRTKSKERIDSSDEFQKEISKINKYIELKNEKSVSLNEAKFIARRKELNAEKEDEKTIEKQMLPNNDIERDFYLDEVLKITADYVEILNQKQLSLR